MSDPSSASGAAAAPAASRRAPLPRLLVHAGVLAAYAALTVVFTWPLAAQFTTALPAGGDAWQHLWNLWWVKTALVDLHTNPFHTTFLYYPDGVNLYFHTLVPLIGVLSIPFQLLGWSLLAVYNLMVVFSFVAAGYGTYLLVEYLTGRRSGAFVAGLIFAFSPYHFAHLLGQLNLTSLQWIPFYILALFRMWRADDGRRTTDDRRSTRDLGSAIRDQDPSGRRPWAVVRRLPSLGWAVAAGVLWAANAYTEWIYAMFLGLFTVWFLVWQVGIARQGPGWRAGALRLAVLAAVAGLLVAPMLVPMLREAGNAQYMEAPAADTTLYSVDVVDAFVPSPFQPWWGALGRQVAAHFPMRNPAERIVFVGYSVLLLAAVGMWIHRRRRAVQFWGWTALGAWVLSLGPVLQVWGHDTFTPFAVKVPLPYLLLYYLPFFRIFRTPGRLAVLVMLALAVLAGYALPALGALRRRPLPRLPRRVWAWGLAAAAAGLVAVEFLAIPYPMVPPGYNVPFYQTLAQDPATYGLLELPLRPMSDYEAYQTVHHKPIVDGYLSRQPPDPFVDNTPVLRYLLAATPVDDPVAAVAASTGLTDLRRAGVRYAIVHWWAFTAADANAMRAKLARVFSGVPVQAIPDHQMEVYDLGGGR